MRHATLMPRANVYLDCSANIGFEKADLLACPAGLRGFVVPKRAREWLYLGRNEQG